ncbi:MAG TPA: hypothetical protein ENG70_02485 [Candidatus Cloacimonetes bacterium]|nr:hypothetical protein [Candidatus Cloacimonadota bacterium]HEX37711.1 hypothetical protein [Candidatus Cloacimonadota bacterium]
MKIKQPVSFVIGIFLLLMGLAMLILLGVLAGVFPLLVGVSLLFTAFTQGRTVTVILGHMFIVIGCILVTWGLYLLPYTGSSILYVFVRPLFWGLISIFGGVCMIYHGFCRCVRMKDIG